MDYTKIKKTCEKNSYLLDKVVNEFLLSYAAGHRGLEKQMDKHFARYKHVLSRFGKSEVNMFKSQWLAHWVFRKDGLLERLMRNPALERFKGEEHEYLQQCLQAPWRYSFAMITEHPAPEFFRMKDVLTNEEYLLYSPGTEDLLKEGQAMLWSNLVSFNGACWQSFGPIGKFQSFGPNELWFYATELDPEIEDEEDALAHIDNDLLPYQLLFSGAAFPRTLAGEDEILHVMAEHDLDTLDTEPLKKDFEAAYAGGVYRFSHREHGATPHFAQAFYDEEMHLLIFSANTDRGFHTLVRDFNRAGHAFPEEAYLRVRIQMLTTAGDILKRKIELNEYEKLFRVDPNPREEKAMENINALIQEILPDINAGRTPDIDAAAKKHGVDPGVARQLVEQVTGSLEKMPGKSPEDRIPEEATKTEKTEDPSPGNNLLNGFEAYLAAEKLLDLAPWNFADETELFGIRIPDSDRIYFVSVMGANGEFTALSAYRGLEGLGGFMDLYEDPDNTPPEAVMLVPHFMLSFNDREELDKEQLDAIKEAGVRFRGRGNWPRMELTEPGFLPAYPEGHDLSDFRIILEQSIPVLEKRQSDPNYLVSGNPMDESFLVRTLVQKKGRLQWEESREVFDMSSEGSNYRLEFSRSTCAEVSRLPVSETVLQADLLLMPSPIKEKGQKGYFPFMLLLVDKESGAIAAQAMLSPLPHIRGMYEKLPQQLLEEMGKLGFRPECLEFRSKLLHGMMDKHLKEAWVRSQLVRQMPHMDEIREFLLSQL